MIVVASVKVGIGKARTAAIFRRSDEDIALAGAAVAEAALKAGR